MTALRGGVAFDSIAKKYNQTGEKTWITSRNYEGAPLDGDNFEVYQNHHQYAGKCHRKD